MIAYRRYGIHTIYRLFIPYGYEKRLIVQTPQYVFRTESKFILLHITLELESLIWYHSSKIIVQKLNIKCKNSNDNVASNSVKYK